MSKSTDTSVIPRLLPGDRVRVRDWRDQNFVDGTHLGFYAKVAVDRVLPGPMGRLREATHLLGGSQSRNTGQRGNSSWARAEVGSLFGRAAGVSASLLYLCVHRDAFCGPKTFPPKDFVAKLDGGSLRDRAERVATALESSARGSRCSGCLAFLEDPRRLDVVHRVPRECLGVSLVPEMAYLLEELDSYPPPP